MQKTTFYDYGHEYTVNNFGLFYPAYMPLVYLQEFATNCIREIMSTPSYAEAKVCTIEDGKGLSWEFTKYSEDPDTKEAWMSRTYTFHLHSDWQVVGFRDHWLSKLTPRCETIEDGDKLIQGLVLQLQAKMKEALKENHFFPLLDKHLKNRNWTNILSTSIRSFKGQAPKKNRMAKEIREFAQRLREALRAR